MQPVISQRAGCSVADWYSGAVPESDIKISFFSKDTEVMDSEIVLLPARLRGGACLQATRTTVNAALKDGGTTMTHHRRGIAGKMLVILQISLCMVLLVSAGLFVRTLTKLNALDPGFNKRPLWSIPHIVRRKDLNEFSVLHQVEERIASLPGVESVTLSREALLAQSGSNSDLWKDSRCWNCEFHSSASLLHTWYTGARDNSESRIGQWI